MRNGQNKRMRGRNRKGGHHHHHHQNPLSRMYESNGQDVKIRGTASHIAEKYLQLARDAQSSGDPIAAENYYQHAEHYFRLIAAAQEQLRQSQPYYQQQQPGGDVRGNVADDGYDDGDNEQPSMGGEPYAPQAQPYYPREQQHHQPQHYQPHQPQQSNQPQQHHFQPRPQQQPVAPEHDGGDVERLPSFITGGQPQRQHSPQPGQGQNSPQGQGGGNGPNGYDGPAERFPLHRRRRRHRGGGPRDYSMDQGMQGDNAGPPPLPSDPQSSDE
ncbi:MAG TPA: DUF4167 domain-containing protein [Xanthobacteraceae bacterium]|nr:DUF4167 domain-containing protein [Xanthobacteraceae bacterium]